MTCVTSGEGGARSRTVVAAIPNHSWSVEVGPVADLLYPAKPAIFGNGARQCGPATVDRRPVVAGAQQSVVHAPGEPVDVETRATRFGRRIVGG